MIPNLPALRAFLAKVEASDSRNNGVTAVTPVTPTKSDTYELHSLVTFVTGSAGNPPLSTPEILTPQGFECDGVLDEREAMALVGDVPPAYARAFAALQCEAPEGLSLARHDELMDDAGRLLDAWGEDAERLGWSAADLIGPDPSPEPLAWALQGADVTRLSRDGADLSDGRKYRRSSAL